jgi:hypothetical protein
MAKGFYAAATTPSLWHYKWRPLQFCLIVDDFGIEYVGIEHFNFLLDLHKKFHGVQFNMAGDKFAGISIKWDYAGKCCQISMPGYIDNLLIKFKHLRPRKPRLSPYACLPITIAPRCNLRLRVTHLLFLMTSASAAFRKLSAPCSTTMIERLTTNSL